jgi:hypothetical protein
MRPFTPPSLLLALVASLTACASGPAYADQPNVETIARPMPRPRRPPAAPSPRIEIVDEEMDALPVYAQEGRRFVLGATGDGYLVRIVNPTGARVEAVVSVDGLDAIDGRPANLSKRGYIIPAYGDVTIDGWRTSLDTVAAFRFSSVRDSYAGRTGHDRNVGVIGVAFFRERPQPQAWRPREEYLPNAGGGGGPVPPSAAPAPALPAPRKSASAAGRSADNAEAESRPGLGTQFGETRDSSVEEVTFDRADRNPSLVAEIRYDDREGLIARGISIAPRDAREAEVDLRDRAEPFPGTRFAQPPPR